MAVVSEGSPDRPEIHAANIVADGIVVRETWDLNAKAVAKVAQIKGVKAEKANFSLICYDLSHISEYARIETADYKTMKKLLPGVFTFILNGRSKLPKIFKTKKKEVGIRVPDNNIARELEQMLGNPLIASSVHDEYEVIE